MEEVAGGLLTLLNPILHTVTHPLWNLPGQRLSAARRPRVELRRTGGPPNCVDSLSAALQATPTAHAVRSVLCGTNGGAVPHRCRGGSGRVIGNKSKVHRREVCSEVKLQPWSPRTDDFSKSFSYSEKLSKMQLVFFSANSPKRKWSCCCFYL